MYPLLTAVQMKACDDYTISVRGVASRTLMERAAHAAMRVLLTHPAFSISKESELLILCGGGNNGGDGFAMARFLLQELTNVSVAYAGALRDGLPDKSRMSEECARQYQLWEAAGGVTHTELPTLGGQIIVDALLGIGLQQAPRAPFDLWIRAVNASDRPVFAVDIPSGVNADDGSVPTDAMRATVTATMAAPKRGLLLYPGADYAGEVIVCDIGIDTEGTVVDTALLGAADLSLLPHRPPYSNKGTFGRVAVIGGCPGMCGAAYLAGLSAYRTGAGLVELVTWEENRIPLQTLLPEAVMTILQHESSAIEAQIRALLARADAVVLGCGLGQSDAARDIVAHVLAQCNKPLVVDADALNLISANTTLQERLSARTATTILTPHLGEAARLMQQDIPTIVKDLFTSAAAISARYGAICVLKDTRTVISGSSHWYVQNCGNSGMAKGGSGDCLAGILGALLAAQPHRALITENPTLLAALGVLLHACAGDAAAAAHGQHGMLARDLADAIGEVLRGWEFAK
ncbi:MAG: NAD(P)H-hydrate dehydratase [Clostridia bacterium]|nr:NAD(P)H-hydrate dehydratase [Clostridia bacterium]